MTYTLSKMNAVEEKLYEVAGAEIAATNVRPGLWAKAFSAALGDEAKTKAIYIQLRVDQLHAQVAAELQQRDETTTHCRAREDAAIGSRLSSLRSLPFEDTDDIPSVRFDGQLASLQFPISATRAFAVAGMLEFQVIDLIKRGHLKGVRHDGDWYFDLHPI